MRHSSRLIASLILSTAFVVGCEVGPNYEPPRVTVLNDFGEQGREPTTRTALATTHPSRTLSGQPPVIAWWQTFHDDEFDTLIARAVDANLDLKLAEARLREARAQRASIRSRLFPDVNSAASYEHVRISENGVASAFGGGSGGGSSGGSSSGSNGSGGSSGGPSSGGGGGSSGGSSGSVNVGGSGANSPGANGTAAIPGSSVSEFNLYQLGFDASWELDLFGGARRASEAADAAVQAAIENRRDVLVTVMAEVARDYVELRSLQRRLQIARENLDTQRRSLALIEELVGRGLTSELDRSRAQAQVATTEASIPPLEVQVGQTIHRLSILLGERPTALADELVTAKPVPPVPDEVPIGLPSDLLRRRPDIRRAERQLAAATANVGVATADLFPRFALNGSVGTQSLEPGNLLDFASRYFSFGPSIRYPLFDAGRRRAQVDVARARVDQAVVTFQQTVLTALRDVEDALIAYQRLQDRTRSLRAAVVANQTSVRIAQDQYQQGLSDFLNVLDAQRQLLSSDDALATSEAEQATALVALYKSLGGGWEAHEPQDLYSPNTARPVVSRASDGNSNSP